MFDKWRHRCYVDLFSGCGIENVQGYGLDWGSPLIAAQMPKPFTQLFLNDIDAEKIQALRNRIQSFPQPNPPHILNLDANAAMELIVDQIPLRGSLTLALIDPYGLHISLDSIRLLSSRQSDLIIYFPDRLDMLRNWDKYYMDNDNSKLDQFLGTGEWRSQLSENNSDKHPEVLYDLYETQLRSLGYQWFDSKRIYAQGNRPIYRLVFATKHPRGLSIWKNVSIKGLDGQSSFNW
jgi:three-Cys-motif partner protein